MSSSKEKLIKEIKKGKGHCFHCSSTLNDCDVFYRINKRWPKITAEYLVGVLLNAAHLRDDIIIRYFPPETLEAMAKELNDAI